MVPTDVYYEIILNEHAGSGNAKLIWPKIAAELDRQKIHYTLHVSEYAGHAVSIAERFGKHQPKVDEPISVILAVGGDGTLHQVIAGLREVDRSDIPVAYIPTGSGNDFARGIHLNPDPLKALNQVLMTQVPHTIDIGIYDEKLKNEHGYFVNNIGIGFDAAVVAATNHSSSKRWLNKYHLGSLSYVFSLVKVFFSQNSFSISTIVNGKQHLYPRAFLVTTTNHPYFGGGVPIMPTASVYDGKLDLVIVEKQNPFYFIFLFIMMLKGKHTKYAAVHHFQADKIQVFSNSLEFGQMDGEEMGSRYFNITFRVSKQKFWLTIPEPKTEPSKKD